MRWRRRRRAVVSAVVLAHDDEVLLTAQLDALRASEDVHVETVVARTRNEGFERARGASVLLIPPGVVVYPNAVTRLRAALESSGAAFAYGLVASRDPDGEIMGALAWDPERLEESNFIGSLALIRRAHWSAMGGHARTGHEDWDMWLRTHAAGKAGAHVATFVGEQR